MLNLDSTMLHNLDNLIIINDNVKSIRLYIAIWNASIAWTSIKYPLATVAIMNKFLLIWDNLQSFGNAEGQTVII